MTLAARGAMGHHGDDFYDTCVMARHWDRLPPRQSRLAGCGTCDEDPENKQMMPPHDASSRCESGKYTHCSCDTCF